MGVLFLRFIVLSLSQIYYGPSADGTHIFVEIPNLLADCTFN